MYRLPSRRDPRRDPRCFRSGPSTLRRRAIARRSSQRPVRAPRRQQAELHLTTVLRSYVRSARRPCRAGSRNTRFRWYLWVSWQVAASTLPGSGALPAALRRRVPKRVGLLTRARRRALALRRSAVTTDAGRMPLQISDLPRLSRMASRGKPSIDSHRLFRGRRRTVCGVVQVLRLATATC